MWISQFNLIISISIFDDFVTQKYSDWIEKFKKNPQYPMGKMWGQHMPGAIFRIQNITRGSNWPRLQKCSDRACFHCPCYYFPSCYIPFHSKMPQSWFNGLEDDQSWEIDGPCGSLASFILRFSRKTASCIAIFGCTTGNSFCLFVSFVACYKK